MEVAVKTLRVDAMGHGEQEFMREARIMVTLNHPCIVKLIGVTKGKPMMLVSDLLREREREKEMWWYVFWEGLGTWQLLYLVGSDIREGSHNLHNFSEVSIECTNNYIISSNLSYQTIWVESQPMIGQFKDMYILTQMYYTISYSSTHITYEPCSIAVWGMEVHTKIQYIKENILLKHC